MADIDGYTRVIYKSEVESRIEELEDSRGYDVVRVRNNDVLATFDDEDEAEQYIEDEDYNPERVVVRQQRLDEDDTRELRSLLQLIEDVNVSRSWTLYNESYFDTSWAQDEAAGALGGRPDFSSWPLSEIDWDAAADERRDAVYEYSYRFDGTTFYSED